MLGISGGGIWRAWPVTSDCDIEDEEEASSEFIKLCRSSIDYVILLVVNKPTD